MAGAVPRLRERRRLVAITTVAVVVETVVVWLIAPHSGLALAPQVSAPAPFDVFHDLRWLLVYHETWLGFVAEVIAFLVFRTAMTAALGARRPGPTTSNGRPPATSCRRSARSTAVIAALLLLFAVLQFATAVFSLSWLFFVAVPVLLMLAVRRAPRGSDEPLVARPARTRLGRARCSSRSSYSPRPARCSRSAPRGLYLPVALAAGVANAWCWLRIVHAVARSRTARTGAPPAVRGGGDRERRSCS